MSFSNHKVLQFSLGQVIIRWGMVHPRVIELFPPLINCKKRYREKSRIVVIYLPTIISFFSFWLFPSSVDPKNTRGKFARRFVFSFAWIMLTRIHSISAWLQHLWIMTKIFQHHKTNLYPYLKWVFNLKCKLKQDNSFSALITKNIYMFGIYVIFVILRNILSII